MNKTILLVAFDSYPSASVSTQRTMAIFNHLNELGWTTILLTASKNCYSVTSEDETITLKNNQFIYRAFAFDIKNKFSIKGKYFGPIATPDQYSPWILTAIILGRTLIKKYKVDIIYSTYPIPSTNVVAGVLAKNYHVPWVADYRDPAPYIHTTNGKWLDMIHRIIDDFTLRRAKKIIFTTDESKKSYEKIFKASEKFAVVENGYDESIFEKDFCLFKDFPKKKLKKFVLYYCGSLYTNGRSPDKIFQALAKLKNQRVISPNNFKLIFQGNIESTEYTKIIQQLNIEDMIKFKPQITHLSCIENMLKSDMLLVIQGSRFNIHIPAKVYECIKANKPILLIAPTNSAVANLANKFPQCESSEDIEAISQIISKNMANRCETLSSKLDSHENLSRKARTKNLHQLLLPLVLVNK